MNTLRKISYFVNKTFALWVVATGVLGFLFPEVFVLAGPWVPFLLGIVMFGMGLTLPSGFGSRLKNGKWKEPQAPCASAALLSWKS